MAIKGTVENVAIAGMACAVPADRRDNSDFVSRFGQEQMAKFEKMVGVRERRFAADGETTADLAHVAALRLKETGCWSEQDVDAVLFVTQTPNHILPATACELQTRLGIKKDVAAYDINLGCSGFVYGVLSSASLLQMQGFRKVLLLGGDTISKLTAPDDAASAPLFGDAGFAMVLFRSDTAAPIRYSFMSDGAGARAILAEQGGRLTMDGMDVFNFTINEVPDLIKEQMEQSGVSADQVDYLVLHQANKFVLKQVALATGFSMKKVPVSMDRFGNTSSASIPLTLCDLKMTNPDMGVKKVVMSGFGVGLSWGTLLMDFDFSACKGIVAGRSE